MEGSAGGGEVRLRGPSAVLRAFLPEELDALERGYRSFDRTVVPVQPTRARVRLRIASSGRLVDGSIDLAVETEGRLAGTVQLIHPPGKPRDPGTRQIGVAILDPDLRGRGLGTEAVALLVDWGFRETGLARVEGPTVVANAAMRRSFDKLGFTHTETLRLYEQDNAMYVLERGDWELVRPGWPLPDAARR